jgi:hypothetical protein
VLIFDFEEIYPTFLAFRTDANSFKTNKIKMKITKYFTKLLFLAFILRGPLATAQELNFTVKVVNPQVRTADPKLFVSLEQAVKELINSTKWTDDVYEQNERLTGSIQLTIDKENSATSFTAKMSVQINRPIFGTDNTTPLMTHLDAEIAINYDQFQPLQYVKNNFQDNLTSVLAYYVYVILGTNADSFSPLGGETYWQTAQDIYNNLPDALKSEWKGKELDNQKRYWFVENVLSPRLKNFRQAIYEYHRQGLDFATTDMNRCKAALMQALEHMDEAHQGYPNTRAIRTFAGTKVDELVEVFKAGSPEQKSRFIAIMTKLDPSNASKFTQVGF